MLNWDGWRANSAWMSFVTVLFRIFTSFFYFTIMLNYFVICIFFSCKYSINFLGLVLVCFQMSPKMACTCITFLHCAFSNVSSNGLLERMHSHIGCICLFFPRCAFSIFKYLLFILVYF